MYNLIVSSMVDGSTTMAVEVSIDRFLESTAPDIGSQLRSLSNEGIAAIESWPAIVMQEGRGPEAAYLGRISNISASGSQVVATVSRIRCKPRFANADLWRLRTQLDIEAFEFHRNHWSIKSRDLVSVLASEGLRPDARDRSEFGLKPLPAPERASVVEARRVMAEWGHTQIDDFLLKAGVKELHAGREIGGRKDRAIAIAKFALDHPGAKTASNSLFSAFIVRSVLGSAGNRAIPDEERGASQMRSAADSTKTHLLPQPNRVFVVHGQDEHAKRSVVALLADLGLEGIVLHEQPNMGRHLLTKFIDEAQLVTFAIILMTADDIGGLKDASLAPRARQNVILELGYFLSHLGQQGVCALVSQGVERPSDFDGIVYIPMDHDGKWRAALKRELRAARMPMQE